MTTIRKVLAYEPAVVVSTVLTFMVGAALPATVGLALFVGGLATMMALLLGAGEGPAVRILFRARDLSSAEAAALAPAVALLCQNGVHMGALRLRVRDGVVSIAAVGAGRRTVVVSAGLVAAVRDRQLPLDQAAAVLGHGAGVVLSGAVRSDPALEFWTLPWQAIRGLTEGVARAFRWLPLVRWAWKGRFILAGIGAVQAGAARQWLVAAVIALVGALSYLVSVWEQAWAATIRELGNEGGAPGWPRPGPIPFPPALLELTGGARTGPCAERPRAAAPAGRRGLPHVSRGWHCQSRGPSRSWRGSAARTVSIRFIVVAPGERGAHRGAASITTSGVWGRPTVNHQRGL